MLRVISVLGILSTGCVAAKDSSNTASRDSTDVAMMFDSATTHIGTAIPAPDPWSAVLAATRVRRLPPAAFAALPPEYRRVLSAQGCRVPQTWRVWKDEPNNLRSGSFARAGQKDWAALCSDGAITRLVVLWGGPASCDPIDSIQRPMADTFGVSVMDGEVAWGKSIVASDLTPTAEGRGEWPPQGIEFIDEGRGSVIYACVAGKWRKILGSD